ncbi:MAG: hypothetical protein E2O84_05800, partial [Bacteroidetes bacterium]
MIFVLLSLSDGAAQGQLVSGTAGNNSRSSVGGSFSRMVNQYRWTSNLSVHETRADWRLDFYNRFRSDAYILFNNRLSFRDEDQVSISLTKPFSGRSGVFYGDIGWYSLSDVIISRAYTGVRFGRPGRFQLEPLVGFSLDRRPGIGETPGENPLRTDAGPAVGFNARLPLMSIEGYDVELAGRGRFEDLSPRRSDLFRLTGMIGKSFNRLSTRTLFTVSSVRRDSYQAASFLNRSDPSISRTETIESTRSDTFDIALDVNQRVNQNFSFGGRIIAAINRRKIRIHSAPQDALIFDTDFRRNDVTAELNTEYSNGSSFFRFSVSVGAQVEERDLVNGDDLPPAQAAQKVFLLRQADFDRGVVEVRFISRFPLSGRTGFQLDLSANIVRHDTPEVNPDDRDELYYRGQIGTSTRLSETLELQLQIFATYFHTVYLKAVRSSENNVQQSLRFRPTVRWRPRAGTRIELVSQVRATYTVDDFVLPGRRPTDQSARELRYDLDAEHSLGETMLLKFTGRVSELRLARFLNDTFSEIPFDSLRTTDLWGRFRVGGRVQAEVGYRGLVRSDYDRALRVEYESVEAGETGQPTQRASAFSSSIIREGRRTITQAG